MKNVLEPNVGVRRKNVESGVVDENYEQVKCGKEYNTDIKEAARKQAISDEKVVEDIFDTFIEIPETIEISPEKAASYKKGYLEEFGRKTSMPTEQEQVLSLQKFVDKKKVEEYKKQLFDAVKNPNGFSKKLKAFIFFKKTKRAQEEIKSELKTERNAKLNSLSATAKFSKNTDGQGAIIIGERVSERMHGVDKGNYVHAADQFGREYFTGPDTGAHNLSKYVNTLAKYFNVNKVVSVRYPVALEGSYSTYETDETVFINQKMIKKLVETSSLVDFDKLSPDDYDKIDPMPVTDPNKSFISSVAINLLTGAMDRTIKYSAPHGKNYDVRGDGVYYLYDMEGMYHEKFVEEQLGELEQFLNQVDNKDGLMKYLSKTAVFLSCLPITDDMYVPSKNHYAKFPRRLYDKIEQSGNISQENKKSLLKALKAEVKNIKLVPK